MNEGVKFENWLPHLISNKSSGPIDSNLDSYAWAQLEQEISILSIYYYKTSSFEHHLVKEREGNNLKFMAMNKSIWSSV